MLDSLKRIMDGGNRAGVVSRAGAASRAGEWLEASRYYRTYLASRPDDFRMWVQLGHSLKEAGDLDGALEAYQSARGLNHLNADLLLNLGHLFKLRSEPLIAYSYYKLSYEIDGNKYALAELLCFPTTSFGRPTASLVPAAPAPPLLVEQIGPDTIETLRAAIQNSGLWDPAWYRETYLADDENSEPLDHFIACGIAAQNDPSQRFSVQGYAIANPDIACSGANPFLHYLWIGARESRPLVLVDANALEKVKDGLPDLFRLRQRQRRADIAVVVHVYYGEIWAEIRKLLANLTEAFDLYISLVKGASDSLEDEISNDFPDAHIVVFPNHGRDAFPFTELLGCGVLDGYELLCKLHTKRSLHREDGDLWRHDLYKGLLGSPETVDTICREMRADPDIGLFVPEGYIFTTEYLGSNSNQLNGLLNRVNLSFDLNQMRFPSGNMFWTNAACLQYLKSLKLDYKDYDVEARQLDGTVAHAVERFVGISCQASGQKLVSMQDIKRRKTLPYAGDRHRLIAFYLPQYHPIAENDAWWGKGFTEWHNLQKGVPYYHGHYQPRQPADLGYYDLRLDEVRTAQADLARAHGVDGFCYYHYWFDGHTLLDLPLKRLMASSLDFPFCLCWANENWTRSWDGLNKDILLPQTYDPEILRRYAADIADYLRDPRYVRYEGKPLFLIYKIMDIPDIASCVSGWRETWRALGIGEVHIAAVRTFLKDPARNPADLGLDSYVDFPPQSLARFAQGAQIQFTREFRGLIYDYQKAVAGDLSRYETEDSTHVHRGVMGCWDNTARRGENAHIAHGASPITYRAWLRAIMVQDAEANPGRDRLIFINAWNEWAEGTYLEPDQRYGHAFLEATKSVRPLARWRRDAS